MDRPRPPSRLPSRLHSRPHPRLAARGALAVEAAFALPVIIAGAMMFIELGNIGLTIAMGGTALERAIHPLHAGAVNVTTPGQMEARVRLGMAAASHRLLDDADIAAVAVERFTSLDAVGAGSTRRGGSTASRTVPAWRITVEIRKDFITPLPRLLGTGGTAFRYQYQQWLDNLPAPTTNMKQD